ncbi:MAG: hypothetical protein IT580_24980, partial [Verrucomicrobiales bacterium]|nr:hypothetical protein [Verrucomicrobiales bacterium]
VVRDDGTLVEMERSPYPTEDTLQELLHRHPEILASVDPDAPRRWLAISRELPVASAEGGSGRWNADHLFLDQDAIPTIVEDKRSSNPEIRRVVVGQMLDYAANVVAFGPVTALRETYNATCVAEGRDPDEDVRALIGPDGDIEAFWRDAETNVRAGRIRMVFVADEVPTELKGVVEFLNRQMNPAEVLAVDVVQYVDKTGGSHMSTLVPQVYGRTRQAAAAKGESGANRKWDETSLLDAMPPAVRPQARSIIEWARSRGLREAPGSGASPSWLCRLEVGTKLVTWLLLQGTGHAQFYFGYLASGPLATGELRAELFERMNRLNDGEWPPEQVKKYPMMPLERLSAGAALDAFLNNCDWFVDRVRSL